MTATKPALLAECRAQRDQIAALQADKTKLRELAQRAIGLLEFNGVRADQYAALGEIRIALAATQGGKS